MNLPHPLGVARLDAGLRPLAVAGAAASLVVSVGAVMAGAAVPLLALALLGAVVAVALRQEWGVVVPLAPALFYPSTLSTFKIALATTALCIVWLGLQRRPLAVAWPAVGAFAGLALFSAVATFQSGYRFRDSIALGLLAIAGLVIGSSLVARRQGTAGVAAIAMFCSAVAAVQLAGLNSIWSDLTRTGGDYVDYIAASGDMRSTSTFGHPLIAGAGLAMLGLLLITARRRSLGLVGVVCLVASISTVSRSSMLAIAAGLLVYLVQERRRLGRLAPALTVIVVAMVAAVQLIPSLNAAFINRLDAREPQTVRVFALHQVSDTWAADPASIVVGHGMGTTYRMLSARGGVLGLTTLDNQYVTAIFDVGLLPLALALCLIGWALFSAPPASRRAGLPALVAGLAALAFADGFYWPSLALLLGVALGAATARPIGDDEGAQED